MTIAARGGAQQLVDVVRLLGDRRIEVADVGLRRPTLDDVFLELIGHGADAVASACDHDSQAGGRT